MFARCFALGSCLVIGCSSNDRSSDEASSASSAAPAGSGGSGGSIGVGGAVGSGGNAAVGDVYANSQQSLYHLEPYSKTVTKIGDFDCVTLTPDPGDSGDGMDDIAVDGSGQMVGVGRVASDGYALVEIDAETAKCTQKLALGGESFTGLTFVPGAAFGAAGDVLLGLRVSGDLVRCDLENGTLVVLGTLASPTKGADLVSVLDAATYVTVTGTDGDRLIAIDPTNANLVDDIGDTGVELIAGLGYWGGTLYGFSYDGSLHSLDPKTGKATMLAIQGAPSEMFGFWGAAVTTVAPIEPPK